MVRLRLRLRESVGCKIMVWRALFAVVATLSILCRILAFLGWPSEAVLVANFLDLATFLAVAVGFAATIVSWISARFLRLFVAVMLLVVVGFMCPFSISLNIASCHNRVPCWKLKAKLMDVNPAWKVDYSKGTKIEHWAIEHLDEINQMKEAENANRTNQRLRKCEKENAALLEEMEALKKEVEAERS